jgi:hypothetical protein
VKQLVDKHMVTGMKISPGSHQVEKCNICTQAKQHVEPFPKEAQREFTEIGEMTFTDVWGAARTRGIRGERYYISFTDGAKRHRKVALMKKKSEADTEVTNYIEFILTQFGKRCKAFRFDRGGEYISKELRAKLEAKGIKVEMTAPYSPQQNGVSERLNRTILERARAMLVAHNLPHFLWPEAVSYAVYIINRSPTTSLAGNITPYEAFWGIKPDVSTLQEFGTECWVLAQGQLQSKLAPKSKPYRFVGISEDSRAWRYHAPKTRKVLASRNVVFQTADGDYTTQPAVPTDPIQLEGEKDAQSEPTSSQKPAEEKSADSQQLELPSSPPDEPITPMAETPAPAPKSRNILQMPPRIPRESRAAAQGPKVYNDNTYWREHRNPNNQSPSKPDAWRHRVRTEDVANVAVDSEPSSYLQATQHPRADEWRKAMKAELKQLEDLGTFSLAELPEGRKALGNKWVYRNKEDRTAESTTRHHGKYGDTGNGL